jgi:UPF0755 protein
MSAGRTSRLLALFALLVAGCGGPTGEDVQLTVPAGAGLAEIVDTLAAREVIRWPSLFRLYARIRGEDRLVKSGRYALSRGSRWRDVLDALTEGRVLTVTLTVPEGFRLDQMASRFAGVSGVPVEAVTRALAEPDAADRRGLPGPTLEGYLFPDSYRFAPGVPVATILDAMVERYRRAWTPRRRGRLDTLGMTERELVTLASIVQAEARRPEEMPRISSVYHNRLRAGWLLQADPTVLYALGGTRERLLFAAIDSVADSPYNTYTQPGLPPGPIGAPGDAALEAALYPANEDNFYFVAWPDGTHVFSRTLQEHNRAVAESRRERGRLMRDARGSSRGSER